MGVGALDEGQPFGLGWEGVDNARTAMDVERAGCLMGSIEDEVPSIGRVAAEEEGGCSTSS